jgi:hypothetical protein
MRRHTLLPHEAVRTILHPQDTLQCADTGLRGSVSKRHAHNSPYPATARL